MEPSKMLGCKEECSSSVSGWTMYIGSPAHENDDYHGNDDDDDGDDDDSSTYKQEDTGNNDDRHGDGDDDKSDDSMASDASSGPNHQKLSWGTYKQSIDKRATGKYSSKQKLHKQKTKKDESRIKVEREEQPLLKSKSSASEAPRGPKVRISK